MPAKGKKKSGGRMKRVAKTLALGAGKRALGSLKKHAMKHAKHAAIGLAAGYSAPLAGSLVALDQLHKSYKAGKRAPKLKTIR
jgi:H+/Cl- antiporter ClcA